MNYASIDLDELRLRHSDFSSKTPFQHQVEAFAALTKTFNLDNDKPSSGILVLPTGAGKTFTAVRWLSSHVIPRNIKILWLAPSFYLLDQAFTTFYENAREVSDRKRTLNIRCVSSNLSHARASSIRSTDDVVIMTLQTAINNLHIDALDRFGKPIQSSFRTWVNDCRAEGVFVVIDEAHHAPAHGCRNLIIGESDSALGLRSLIPNLNVLGLTATPTYTEKSRRGWLWKIFNDGVIYEADKTKLIAQKVLARPNYIEISTGKELEVNDQLYDRLVKQHKDLPETIIETLASDQHRNNLIVETYLKNQKDFGKTIIFADRWFQCVYLKEKLLAKGIKADAIYSKIDADPGSAEARNQRTQTDNDRILKQFKTGKDEAGNDAPLDVLINVRMLTEGADVPTVKTVFITRQTTSSILMTQMIGRALRGELAGGSSEANVVLFFDNWKRLIDWARTEDGDTQGKQVRSRNPHPHELISIQLVEELSRQIDYPDYSIPEFSKIFPIGWYKTEIVYADSANEADSTEGFTEFVMVYDHTKAKIAQFISFLVEEELSKAWLDEWAKQYLEEEWMLGQAEEWIDYWFDRENDNIGNKLASDLIKLARHIAQNQDVPAYYSFEEREYYDLTRLAERMVDLTNRHQHECLKHEFSKPGNLWKTFYKSFPRFKTAVDAEINNILQGSSKDVTLPRVLIIRSTRELTEAEKRQIKARDKNTCLCCGVWGKVTKLQIDHILPFNLGGETTLENSQTLCRTCNNAKGGDQEIDFRITSTPLSQPKRLKLFEYTYDSSKSLKRIVNFFYHCNACYELHWHCIKNEEDQQLTNARSRFIWEIKLHPGNNPEWLLQHRSQLLYFVQNRLSHPEVEAIKVTVAES